MVSVYIKIDDSDNIFLEIIDNFLNFDPFSLNFAARFDISAAELAPAWDWKTICIYYIAEIRIFQHMIGQKHLVSVLFAPNCTLSHNSNQSKLIRFCKFIQVMNLTNILLAIYKMVDITMPNYLDLGDVKWFIFIKNEWTRETCNRFRIILL